LGYPPCRPHGLGRRPAQIKQIKHRIAEMEMEMEAAETEKRIGAAEEV